jgi:hypothetical protein
MENPIISDNDLDSWCFFPPHLCENLCEAMVYKASNCRPILIERARPRCPGFSGSVLVRIPSGKLT